MSKLIATDEELLLLFDNKLQRDAFIKIINRILEEINMRTVNVHFVNLTEHFIEIG